MISSERRVIVNDLLNGIFNIKHHFQLNNFKEIIISDHNNLKLQFYIFDNFQPDYHILLLKENKEISFLEYFKIFDKTGYKLLKLIRAFDIDIFKAYIQVNSIKKIIRNKQHVQYCNFELIKEENIILSILLDSMGFFKNGEELSFQDYILNFDYRGKILLKRINEIQSLFEEESILNGL
jgi:hypothetical protein